MTTVFPDGYGAICWKNKWYVVQATFYQDNVPYLQYKGKPCKVELVKSEDGTIPAFESEEKAAVFCQKKRTASKED